MFKWFSNIPTGKFENGNARFKPVNIAANILEFFSSRISVSSLTLALTDFPPFLPLLNFPFLFPSFWYSLSFNCPTFAESVLTNNFSNNAKYASSNLLASPSSRLVRIV